MPVFLIIVPLDRQPVLDGLRVTAPNQVFSCVPGCACVSVHGESFSATVISQLSAQLEGGEYLLCELGQLFRARGSLGELFSAARLASMFNPGRTS